MIIFLTNFWWGVGWLLHGLVSGRVFAFASLLETYQAKHKLSCGELRQKSSKLQSAPQWLNKSSCPQMVFGRW